MHSNKDDSLHWFWHKMFLKRDCTLNREKLKKKNANELLKVHDDSQEHDSKMATWKDM